MTNVLAKGTIYLCHTGIETDLIFNRGVDLPHFSLYPFLEHEAGRDIIHSYVDELIDIASSHGLGVVMETPTWMANTDRAAPLGYSADDIARINADAVTMIAGACSGASIPVVVSGNIGPRDDAYVPSDQMDAITAREYHAHQIKSLAQAGAQLASGYTLAYVNEAVGMVRAAQDAGIPSMISFTVETDGNLPDGTPLPDAIASCDAQTDGGPEYYMINCAHPTHFDHVLDGGAWMARIKGLIVNASMCSHAELDEATELDPGNPTELGQQLGALAQAHPNLQVFGGCCGTDARHMREIAGAIARDVRILQSL